MTNEELFIKLALLLQSYFETNSVNVEVQEPIKEIVETITGDIQMEEPVKVIEEKKESISCEENDKIKNKKRKFLL